MSFFATIAIPEPSSDALEAALTALRGLGLGGRRVNLAAEHGVRELYGLDMDAARVIEIEILDGKEVGCEDVLAGARPPDLFWTLYQRFAASLGRSARWLGDDPEVTALLLKDVHPLPAEELLRTLAENISARPLVLNLDPEFAIRFGEVTELAGWEAIRRGVWAALALGDLERGLRLRIDE
ncbi:MAG: hypothetical protein ABIO70_07530 [Pseudomonadota bacterium]